MPEDNTNNNDDLDLNDTNSDANNNYADELLGDDGEGLGSDFDEPKKPNQNRSFKQKVKDFLKDLWQNKTKRRVVIASAFVLIIAVIAVPNSRYFILNTAGVRSSASVTVLDQSTSQPLKNVSVTLAGQETKTDDNGTAKLEKLKLGSTKLVIKKRAFADTHKNVTLGWGSNPLGNTKIEPVGVQFTFDVQDFLSDKPIEKAEAVSGEYSAFSNQEGQVVLTIDQVDANDEQLEVMLKAKNYRDENIDKLPENKEAMSIKMVPARKHMFVSKRSGKYDVYKMDVDGQNEQLVLSGTGMERDDMVLVPHPDKDMAALVSSRQNARNKDGFLLSTLTLISIDGEDVNTEALTTSERVQIIGWSGDQLVYVKIRDGASTATPDRHKLITYNAESGETKEIAKANYFNDVLMVDDNIYYAPSAAYQEGKVGLIKVSAKGEDQKTVFDQEVWNIFRTTYDKLMFSVQKDWYEYKIKDGKVLAANGPPPIQVTKVYIDSPDKKHSLWIDQRDGKGALVEYNVESSEEKVAKTQSGLTYPVRWITDDTVVYRINTGQETADYVINFDGGEAKKIVDVTNTGGVDRWYYY